VAADIEVKAFVVNRVREMPPTYSGTDSKTTAWAPCLESLYAAASPDDDSFVER